MEKRKFLTLPRLELRPLGHPTRSQSLYRLRYPGSSECIVIIIILTIYYRRIEYRHIDQNVNLRKLELEKIYPAQKKISIM
jgi:hypothetical protein